MPSPVARVGDQTSCPAYSGDSPHKGGTIISGAPSVLMNGLPVAVVGSQVPCQAGGMDTIVQGSPSVLVNGLPVARIGDKTAHGGVVITCSSNIIVA